MTKEQRKKLLETVADQESKIPGFWAEADEPYYRCDHRDIIIDDVTGEVSRVKFDEDGCRVISRRPTSERFVEQIDAKIIARSKRLIKNLQQQIKHIESNKER